MSAHLRYRCRLCGQEFKGVHGGKNKMDDYFRQLLHHETVSTETFVLRRFDVHHYQDGSTGFGDLIGIVLDDP